MNMNTMMNTCQRCAYVWTPRTSSTPRQCPYCKSPKWNLPRTFKSADPLEAALPRIAAAARTPIHLTTAAQITPPMEAPHYERDDYSQA